MSTKSDFSRCPYCRHKLDKTPKRKTLCPQCSKPIYVRGGKLLREDALAEGEETKPKASKPKASKPKASPRKPKKSTARPLKQGALGQLAADLLKMDKETYRGEDRMAGLQLLLKLAGALLASGNLASLLTGLFGGASTSSADRSGLAGLVQELDTTQLIESASSAYADLNEQEQFYLRAAVSWIQNGFQLPEAEEPPVR
ncbi:MAG: hypothetical protein ACOYL7_11535 [Caldilinea sp.]